MSEAWRRGFGRPQRTLELPVRRGSITLEVAVEAMIRARGFKSTTARSVRDNLLGGRFREFRRVHGVITLEDLTPALTQRFLEGVARTADNPEGLAPATCYKIRQQLLWLGRWAQAELGVDPVGEASVARTYIAARRREADEEEPPFTDLEVHRLLTAAAPGRDQLIVDLLLHTGLRPSELVAVRIDQVHLDAKPPYIAVRGTIHDPESPKSRAGVREVPLDFGRRGLQRRMRTYLTSERPNDVSSAWLLYSDRRDAQGNRTRLTHHGVASMLKRLQSTTGIHCNPYRFRHHFCTVAADHGVPEFALATVMGHASPAMISRYYRSRRQVALELMSRVRL